MPGTYDVGAGATQWHCCRYARGRAAGEPVSKPAGRPAGRLFFVIVNIGALS